MTKLHLRTDPLTLYLLLLATYGVGMTLRALQRQKDGVETAAVVAAVARAGAGEVVGEGEVDQGAGMMVSISRKKRSPSRDNLWWLEGVTDLLGRLAVPETRCRKMMVRQEENCGSPGVLSCLDGDVAPHYNSCLVYFVIDHQGEQRPLPSNLFLGCKQVIVNIGKDTPPRLLKQPGENYGTGVDPDEKVSRFLQVQGSALQWSVLPRLISSGLLLGMKQLLIEVHVDMGDGSKEDDGEQAAPTLRDHWRVLEMLSSLGFRRAHFILNPRSSVFHPVPTVMKDFMNLPLTDPHLDTSYFMEPDVYRRPLSSNPASFTFDSAAMKAPDLGHELDSEESDFGDTMTNEHLISGILLYLYRPDVPLPAPPTPYQHKEWKNNYDPEVSTQAILVQYNASELTVNSSSITNIQDELLLV